MIVRLGERLGLARELDGQVWCTSTNPQDDPLEALAAEYGYACHRGSELDVLQRFLDVVEARGAETVIRVTGDNPLTDPAMMDHMIRAHREAGAEYTYTEDPPRGTRCEVIAASALRRCRELAEDPDASEYMTLMLRRPDHFKVLPVAATDPAIRRPELRLTIDTPEDLEVVRAVYEAFAGQPPSLAEVIAWLDAHAELRDLNSAIRPKWEADGINVRLRGDASAD